jgi:hypothetical protein
MIRTILLLLGLAIAILAPGLVRAQGAPFACNDDLYQVRAGTGGNPNGALLRFPQSLLTTGGTFDAQGRYYFLGQGAGNIAPSAVYRVDTIPVTTGAMDADRLGLDRVRTRQDAASIYSGVAAGFQYCRDRTS